MSALTPLKTTLVSSLFAVSAVMNPAQANTGELIETPLCDSDYLFEAGLKRKSFSPSGIKASTEKWDMEIYKQADTDRWRLMARSKDPKIARPNQICQLAWGRSAYTETSWYKQNFAPASKSGNKAPAP